MPNGANSLEFRSVGSRDCKKAAATRDPRGTERCAVRRIRLASSHARVARAGAQIALVQDPLLHPQDALSGMLGKITAAACCSGSSAPVSHERRWPSISRPAFLHPSLARAAKFSPHAVASYRDTFLLLLAFAAKHMSGAPPNFQMEQLDVSLIEKLLRHLEQDRGNSVRTRNPRLAAAYAFFRFVAIREPALGLQCQHILMIPSKRREHGPVEFLTAGEAAALVAAPIHEHVSPTGIERCFLSRSNGSAQLRIDFPQTSVCGARHRRSCLLPRQIQIDAMHSAATGRHYRPEGVAAAPARRTRDTVFPSSRGYHLSADALQRLASRNVAIARRACPRSRKNP